MSILLWLQIYFHYNSFRNGQKIRLEFQITYFFSYCDIDLLNKTKEQLKADFNISALDTVSGIPRKPSYESFFNTFLLPRGWKDEEARKRR